MPEERKTYWHLEGARRVPTDYEVATSRMLYYVGRGFEVEVPLSDWYRRYQQGSPLVCDDWDRFADPRETTYAKYVALQHGQGDARRRVAAIDRGQRLRQQAGSRVGRHAGTAAAAAAPPLSRAADAVGVRRSDGAQRADHDRRGAAGGGRDAPGSSHRLPDGDAPAAAARIRRGRASSCGRPIRRGSRCAS